MKVLTGVQPTNTLHIGNYFGALKPAVELQNDHNLFMMIVDYHAITVPFDPKQLNDNILFVAATYLAAGIDPRKTILFQQSQVPAHTELAWVLQTQTHMGEARRMTQFKDKSGGKEEAVSLGLFTYPVLQAADILLYDAEAVPVGQDQKQHIELTRNLAERFNNKFGETFVVPEPMITSEGARILALNDPEKKMSKSAPSAKSYISLMDSDEEIHKKIRSAVTDSQAGITVDDNRPGLKNLLTIYRLVTGDTLVEIADRYREKGMKALKDDLAEVLTTYLRPLRAEINGYLENKDELINIIRIGSEAANSVAQDKIEFVRKQIGISF